MIFEEALFSAPMASVTDTLFRKICEHYGGADIYFTEMISAPALLQQGPLEAYYCDFSPCPEKTVAQLVGGRSADLIRAAAHLCSRYPELGGIDINMGCSAPLIRKKKAGIAWMSRYEELPALLGQLRDVTAGKSLSVKFRIGLSDDEKAFFRFLEILASAKIDFVTFHGRTQKDKFRKNVRWDYFDKAREYLPFPVIANGDIDSLWRYRALLRDHNPYGVMIGRAAARAPWLFPLLSQVPRKNPPDNLISAPVDFEAYVRLFTRHLGENVPLSLQKNRIIRFTLYLSQNLFWGHHLLTAVSQAPTPQEAVSLLHGYFEKHPEEKRKIWSF